MRTSVWRLIAYALIILAGAASALPNILSPQQLAALPDFLPKQQLALGLDLRGGAHVVLEVDAKSLINERLQNLVRDARRALGDAKIGYQWVRRDGNAIVVALDDGARRNEAVRALNGAAASADELSVTEVSPTELRVELTKAGTDARMSAAVE